MNNFLKFFLIIFFCFIIICCANNDNLSDESTWPDERLIGDNISGYVTIVSKDYFENISALGETKTESRGYNKNSSNEFYLVKYNSFGTKMWSEKLVQNDGDSDISIVFDYFGNIFLTSYFNFDRNKKTKSNGYELFLTKFNSFGIILWTKKIGESSVNNGMGLAIDSFDNIYVTGFSKFIFGDEAIVSNEKNFFIKLNSFGIKQWTKKIESFPSGSFLDIWVDSSNLIHITGVSDNNFEENYIYQKNDVIILRYNSDGILQ